MNYFQNVCDSSTLYGVGGTSLHYKERSRTKRSGAFDPDFRLSCYTYNSIVLVSLFPFSWIPVLQIQGGVITVWTEGAPERRDEVMLSIYLQHNWEDPYGSRILAILLNET